MPNKSGGGVVIATTKQGGGGSRSSGGSDLGPVKGNPNLPTVFHNKAANSSYGVPLAIVFGTIRVSGTIILAGLFNRNVGYPTMGTGVVQVALCEGEISDVLAIWREKVKSTPASLGVTIATGTLPQSPFAWMTTNFPAFALGYGGVATASCSTGWTTAATGELERSSFEVKGLNADVQDGSSTAYDAHPWKVIRDILTSTIYGLRWDSSLLGDQDSGEPFQLGPDGTLDSGYPMYCSANGWWISMAVTEQKSARDIIAEVLDATDSVALWSEGSLKIRPLGESLVNGSVTYIPDMTPRYDLGASEAGADFLADGGDPAVTMERAKRADVFNCHPVEYSNRFPSRKDTTGTLIAEPFNAYNADVVDGDPDPIDVEKVGLRKAAVSTFRCITRQAHAESLSRVFTMRSLYTERNTYRFRLGWRYALLEPTDVVTITDAALGLDRQLVRIREIEEDEDGAFDVVADEIGLVLVAGYPTLTVTLSTSSVIGLYDGINTPVVTTPVTASAHGGSGSFTYAWAKVSGTTVTVDASTAATTTFSRTGLHTATAVYRCTVTDTVTTLTATADVNVSVQGTID